MQKLGWLVIVIAVTLGLFGYHKKQGEPLTFTTPQGYAAPTTIPRTSWKDSIPEFGLEDGNEKVLILEMAPETQPTVVKNVKKPRTLKHAKSKARPVKGTRTAKLLRKR